VSATWPRRWRSAELDGLEPDDLRQILREEIDLEVDKKKLARARRIEEAQRRKLQQLADELEASA
jgi:hypothetical protein